MLVNGSFEQEYQNNKNFWGERPSPVILNNQELLIPGTVLDVGAGDGRNAIFLAKEGFAVTALDVAPSGLKIIEEKAKAKGVKVATIEGDIRQLEVTDQFDNVISNFTLHFLGESQVLQTLHKIVNATKPGGVNIIDDFTPNGPLAKFNPEDYLSEDMLVKFYENLGWQILFKDIRQVETKVYETPDQPLTHEAIAIVAKKPSD